MVEPARRPSILAIGTALPPYSAAQTEIAEWMAASFADRPALGRMIRTLCTYSGIERRYSCIAEYYLPPLESRYAPGAPPERSPSTAERMAVYAQAAPPLGAEAACQALAEVAHRTGRSAAAVAGDVTHLIVVTCTGFFAPGIDFVMARLLDLPSTVDRTLIGFMGCSAMFNGLRLASQVVQADPRARVLVVSVELCSLHSQPNPLRDHLIGSSLFADGASACLVGLPEQGTGGYYTLDAFHTRMQPETEDAMAWQIGNYGFDLRLSPRVPDHLAEAAPVALAALFARTRPRFWAIHPGGRAIVDRLAEIYGLGEDETAASRAVLRRAGNLSSATILFVLDEQRRQMAAAGQGEPATGVAMAFGPGLVLELARLTHVPAPLGAAQPEPARALGVPAG